MPKNKLKKIYYISCRPLNMHTRGSDETKWHVSCHVMNFAECKQAYNKQVTYRTNLLTYGQIYLQQLSRDED